MAPHAAPSVVPVTTADDDDDDADLSTSQKAVAASSSKPKKQQPAGDEIGSDLDDSDEEDLEAEVDDDAVDGDLVIALYDKVPSCFSLSLGIRADGWYRSIGSRTSGRCLSRMGSSTSRARTTSLPSARGEFLLCSVWDALIVIAESSNGDTAMFVHAISLTAAPPVSLVHNSTPFEKDERRL
jgi:hypothetical protein